METPGAYDLNAYPTCKICDRGTLMPRKIRRLSGPAVAIGYILLIPSILGMAACAILLIVSLLAGVAGAAHGSAFATAFAGTWSIAMVSSGIGCFVFGLLGWLLIMKKHVLQCGYCGAVVNAVAPISSQPERTTVSVRNVILGALFILGITGAIWAFVVAEAGIQSSTSTATATEPTQPMPDNSTAGPAQPDAWKPFAYADGRFSVLFPGTPTQSSQPLHFSNSESGTAYDFSVSADNGKTTYLVVYSNLAPDVAAKVAEAVLQGTENGFWPGTTLLSNQAIDLDGVPGRAITAADAEYSYTAHDFVVGTRFYRLCVTTSKGYTATQADQFMNSFRIQ